MQVHFVICPKCAEHGSVVFPNGTESREFWTKELANKVLFDLVSKRHISQDEANALEREIAISSLSQDKLGITHSDKVCPLFHIKLLALTKRN